MKKIAILSDIHANLSALNLVLDNARNRGISDFCILGDTVDYDRNALSCLSIVRDLDCPCVIGNVDISCLKDLKQTNLKRANARHLNKNELVSWLEDRPYQIEAHQAWLAHGSLNQPEYFRYIHDRADAGPSLATLKRSASNVGFFGHTHQPAIFASDPNGLHRLDEHRYQIDKSTACVVTVGSVGNPRTNGDFRASWVIWNPEDRIVDFQKTAH